jgi:hypothetical protein
VALLKWFNQGARNQIELEAALALGEIQLQRKNPNVSRKRLADTEKAVRLLGFDLIARKASLARQAVI